MESLEVRFIKTLFNSLGRVEKQKVLDRSNLTDKERCLLAKRFIEGLSVKESADYFCMEPDAYNKAYHRIVLKLYSWFERKAKVQGVSLEAINGELINE